MSAFGACVLLMALGCRPARQPSAAPQPQPPRAPVKLLVIDEPEVAGRIQELWQTRGEGSLNIAIADMAQIQSSDEVWSGADVVVFPLELLGDFLSEGRIVPFVEGVLDEPSYRWREVADALRRRVVVWDRTVYAVPMGAATPLFWYRADIWERQGWQPPTTWSELSDRLEKLRQQGDGKAGWTVEPLAEGWAARTLLARASAYALHPSYLAVLFHPDTMDALIDGPPFIEALQDLVHDTAPESLELGPGQVVLWAHEHGQAVAIGWWPKAADATPDWQQLWNVHTLPAANKAYDRHNERWEERPEARQPATFAGYAGLLAAVTRQARNQRAAANFCGHYYRAGLGGFFGRSQPANRSLAPKPDPATGRLVPRKCRLGAAVALRNRNAGYVQQYAGASVSADPRSAPVFSSVGRCHPQGGPQGRNSGGGFA
ncbi:MAG: hypothetical protein KatS3mg110_4377 [Pirellulaceae bacterium]|nr:MAG: hypothetical protein KatS3mg110_4377 [Pirellulaceae bacterium]